MTEYIFTAVSSLPHSLATIILAMVPVTELRVSIPFAITVYKMSPILAFLYSVLGNIIAGIIVIFFVENILHLMLKRSQYLDKIWQKYIVRIKTKNEEKFEKWGAVALVLFVAIPLPMTGIFTGAVAASIFQIPVSRAVIFLSLGSLISGIIVTLLTMGIMSI